MKDNERIAKHYHAASKLALTLVEKHARQILRDHNKLDEFVMAMGGWFFTYKVGAVDSQGIVIEPGMDRIIHETLDYMEPVTNIMCEWDDYLKITGEPVRFTAHGTRITHW